MGTPEFSVKTLEALTKHHNVLVVITQPDKKSGRGSKLTFPPVKQYALDNNIEVLQPTKIKDKDFIAKLKTYNADIYIVVAYGQILSKQILDIPKYGAINVHASLLPKYRGAAPIQWAIINGEKTTGITIMYMDEGLDTGDMLLKKEIDITHSDNFLSLHDKLKNTGATLLIEALEKIQTNSIVREKQDDKLSSYAKMITKNMGLIDFNDTTEQILNLIRALDPWPSSFAYYKNTALKIWKAQQVQTDKQAQNGEIISIIPKEGIVVKTSDGAILITEVQGVSSKRMKASDYLRGNKILEGQFFNKENDLCH